MQMKRKYWSGLLMGAIASGMFLTLKVMADSPQEDEKVKAPMPLRLPTHDYVPEPASEQSNQGELIFKQANCIQCHSIKNAGGNLGPMLDGIGYRRSSEFLFAHLAASNAAEKEYFRLTGRNRTMYQHPRITPANATAIVSFLMTLPEPEGGFVLTPHVISLPARTPASSATYVPNKKSKSSEEGQKLFRDKGCIACHSVQNAGGWLGPKLDGLGGRLDRSAIMENINNPAQISKREAGDIDVLPQMPKLNLKQEEIEKITNYLLTLPNSQKAE